MMDVTIVGVDIAGLPVLLRVSSDLFALTLGALFGKCLIGR